MAMRLHLHALTDNATTALGNMYEHGHKTCPWIASTENSLSSLFYADFYFILTILCYECISLIFPKLEIRSLQNVQVGI